MSEEHREDVEYVNEVKREMLESEKVVYVRVGRYDRIAQCMNVSKDGILLALYERGDLKSYLKDEVEVDRSQKAGWILSIIKKILHFRNANVLVDDMALRNMLIADDLSIRCVIYSIVTWKRYECDLFTRGWTRPLLSDLPEVGQLFCGDIIKPK